VAESVVISPGAEVVFSRASVIVCFLLQLLK